MRTPSQWLYDTIESGQIGVVLAVITAIGLLGAAVLWFAIRALVTR
jgi:hypothetical protein